MERYEPYFAEDTDGVHLEVFAEGHFVQAYVSREILSRACGTLLSRGECVGVCLRFRDRIEGAVIRRVREQGRETVIVRFEELGTVSTSLGGTGGMPS